MRNNERITMDMTMKDMIVAMSDGNPGAIAAMFDILDKAESVDPDDIFSPIGPILSLDSHRFYGSRLYMFWNDVCGRDATKMLAVLRADQLGQLAGCTEAAINHAVDHCGEGLDLDAVLAAVQKRLPKFGRHSDRA